MYDVHPRKKIQFTRAHTHTHAHVYTHTYTQHVCAHMPPTDSRVCVRDIHIHRSAGLTFDDIMLFADMRRAFELCFVLLDGTSVLPVAASRVSPNKGIDLEAARFSAAQQVLFCSITQTPCEAGFVIVFFPCRFVL